MIGFVPLDGRLDALNDVPDGLGVGQINLDCGPAIDGKADDTPGNTKAARAVEVGEAGVKRKLGIEVDGGAKARGGFADGVVAAVKQVGLKVPLVVRLEGTNVDAGKKIIRESGLNVLPADDLDDAAQKIVKAVKEVA